jgi:hypothetical protein
MPRITTRTIALVGGGAALLVAGTLGVVALTDDDPTESVDAIAVGSVDPSTTDASPGTTGKERRVLALEELTGTLERSTDDDDDDDDVDDFVIGVVEVDFGPDSWIITAPPMEDYDGDGTAEALREELDGLVGTEVTLVVRYDDDDDDDDRDDADVYTIGGLAYRDTAGGAAAWARSGGEGGATREALTAAAAEALGPGARVVELEPEDDDTDAWEAEVEDAGGGEHQVLLAADGTVIDVRPDDD